jgi:hypothetical protein
VVVCAFGSGAVRGIVDWCFNFCSLTEGSQGLSDIFRVVLLSASKAQMLGSEVHYVKKHKIESEPLLNLTLICR